MDLQPARPVALRGARAGRCRAGRDDGDRLVGGTPIVLGGDLNTRDPVVPGFEASPGHSVDHVLARLLRAGGPGRTLERGRLSDHAPVLADVA